MADPAFLKQLKIKSGVVKRLVKEHAFYIKESEKAAATVEKLKNDASNEDEEYAAKKAEGIVLENKNMVLDTLRRCGDATEVLQNILDGQSDEIPEVKEALDILASAKQILA